MTITKNEYFELRDADLGYCPTCDDVADADGYFEQDARGRHCHECDDSKAMGIEEALMIEAITIG